MDRPACASSSWRTAIEPSYAEAHNWTAYFALLTGQPALDLVSAARAVELNPLSAEAVSNLSWS